MATPLHIIPVNNGFPRACIACARQYKHLRLLCKNTPRYSLYTDLMKILEIDISKLENIRCKLYICDRCICLTQRVNSLREPCQTHVNNLMKIEQSRRKRIQMHSASPNVRIENGSYGRIETGTPRSESEKANISLKFLQKMPNANYMVGPRQSENQEAHSKVLTGKINLSDHVRDTITDQREINRAEERNETDRPRNETKKSNILLKFSPKVPTTDQIIDTKSCQSGNQVADSTVSIGEIKLEDHMYAVTCCTDQPELSPGEKDTNRPRYDTEQSNFLQNFPKIVSNTELMVGTHQSEILKADSKVSSWENKLLDHVYDASTDRLSTNGGEERKETDRRRNETKKAIILLQFPKKGPSTNQIIDTKSCQNENRVADSKVSTGDIKLVDHVYAASCSTDQSELSPSEKRKDTDEHRNETKQSEVSLNFPKRVPDTEQMVGTQQSNNQKADSKVSTGEIKVLDHEYAADSCRDTADIYKDHSILKSFITESIPSNEIETLSKLSTTKSDLDSRKVSSKIMQLPHVSTAIRNLFLNEITFKMDRICGVRQKSVLVSPVCELNDKTYFNKIINEMEKRCPFILDILIAMCSPAHFNLKDTNYTVAAMYSMAMHSRNPKLKTAFKRKRAASSKKRHGGNNVS